MLPTRSEISTTRYEECWGAGCQHELFFLVEASRAPLHAQTEPNATQTSLRGLRSPRHQLSIVPSLELVWRRARANWILGSRTLPAVPGCGGRRHVVARQPDWDRIAF